ncbi:MAG TPA: hypothetical protein VF403_16545, partial [Kofleriaceae bacterium]
VVDRGEGCDDGPNNGHGQGTCMADCSALQLCPDPTQQDACQNEVGGDGAAIDSGLTAPVLLFQPTFESAQVDGGQVPVNRGGVNQSYSIGIYIDPQDHQTKLLVNDRGNNRVLIYNHVPRQSGELPDLVVGQSDFTSGLPDAGLASPSAAGFHDNVHVSVCGTGEMFVSDAANNRVLVWRRVPTANGVPADFVLGQPDFASSAAGTSLTTLNRPYAAHCIARKLVIVDSINNRLLIYDQIPSSGADRPTRVIGQQDFDSAVLRCSPTSLNYPYQVRLHAGRVYVSDGSNHRVLVFDDSFWTSASRPIPIAVLGQPDFTTCALKAPPDAASLSTPNSVAAQGDLLAVSDHDNNRIVVFRLPVTTGAAAELVIGHDTFNDASLVAPPTATSFQNPKGMIFDGSFLWVGDNKNHRVMSCPVPPL